MKIRGDTSSFDQLSEVAWRRTTPALPLAGKAQADAVAVRFNFSGPDAVEGERLLKRMAGPTESVLNLPSGRVNASFAASALPARLDFE